MKNNLSLLMLNSVLNIIIRPEIRSRETRKRISHSYREILSRAGEIGGANPLLGAYGLAAYFIAMNRCTSLSPEENCKILEQGLSQSRMYRMFMGTGQTYFSEKKMAARRNWSRETHKRKYANDWIVDVLEKSDDYEFGLDYTQCGVCKLCRDEGCPELAQYLCRLDFMTVDMMGIVLKRTMTLAQGDPKCDFRFSKQTHHS